MVAIAQQLATFTPEVIEAAGNTRWESVGLAAVLLVGVVAFMGGMVKVIQAINSGKEETASQIESAVYRANGIPVAMLDCLPIPAWYKDRFGVMRYINQAYMAKFNIRASDYIGRTDFDAWPENIARAFVANDQKVINTGLLITTMERVPLDAQNPKGPSEMFMVQKAPYRQRLNDSVIDGTVGYLIDGKQLARAAEMLPGVWEDPNHLIEETVGNNESGGQP